MPIKNNNLFKKQRLQALSILQTGMLAKVGVGESQYQTSFLCSCDDDGDFNMDLPANRTKIDSVILVNCPSCGKRAAVKSITITTIIDGQIDSTETI